MENNLPSKVEIWSTIISFVYGVLNFTNQDPYSSESFELSVESFCAMKLTSFLITPDSCSELGTKFSGLASIVRLFSSHNFSEI